MPLWGPFPRTACPPWSSRRGSTECVAGTPLCHRRCGLTGSSSASPWSCVVLWTPCSSSRASLLPCTGPGSPEIKPSASLVGRRVTNSVRVRERPGDRGGQRVRPTFHPGRRSLCPSPPATPTPLHALGRAWRWGGALGHLPLRTGSRGGNTGPVSIVIFQK